MDTADEATNSISDTDLCDLNIDIAKSFWLTRLLKRLKNEAYESLVTELDDEVVEEKQLISGIEHRKLIEDHCTTIKHTISMQLQSRYDALPKRGRSFSWSPFKIGGFPISWDTAHYWLTAMLSGSRPLVDTWELDRKAFKLKLLKLTDSLSTSGSNNFVS